MSTSGYINHCVGVRLGVSGSGNLRPILKDKAEAHTEELAVIPMIEDDGELQTSPASYESQVMQLELKTTVINEFFEVDAIIFYVAPSAESYPGN